MNEQVFDHFPVLETPRLVLRQVAAVDIPLVYCFNADLETLRYVPRDPYESLDQAVEKVDGFARGFADHKGIWWTFELKDSGKAIGYGGLFDVEATASKAEIGYGTLPEFWGQGYVSEAVAEMTRFGREEMALHRIYGLVHPENGASARVLEKLGYEREGCLRGEEYAREKWFDLVVWGWVA